MATHWCDGDVASAKPLVRAWQVGEQGVRSWPNLSWYDAGVGQTQGRWLTRPVVPNITLLDEKERAPWERKLFTLPEDIGRPNMAFEGGIRMYTEKQFDDAVRIYDAKTLPLLEQTIAILNQAIKQTPKPVLEDQRDRYHALLLNFRTTRNLFDSQAAINHFLLQQGEPAALQQRLRKAIHAEIENTKEWIRFFRESRTYSFRVAEEETPFLYKTPAEDMKVKLLAMQAHLNDTPGPDLKELSDESSERDLLYYE